MRLVNRDLDRLLRFAHRPLDDHRSSLEPIGVRGAKVSSNLDKNLNTVHRVLYE